MYGVGGSSGWCLRLDSCVKQEESRKSISAFNVEEAMTSCGLWNHSMWPLFLNSLHVAT
ncbi:hypothetical protein RchiOBHm_Chr4g0416481 [Rosa chinensis]|uniref:Uncharacterized protein n=1 Tax=Rosa chinensis TaxID=74649 RepID=A0A2P6QWU7_ROSCH|nr:hypothetical protein RchiOBHm_Chr4g0416481 [Rosa chinensis]